MNTSDFKKSRFLTQADIGAGVLATILRIGEENVAMEGAEKDHRPVIYFAELEKGLVCNSTNAQVIADITQQTENVEKNWIGARVVLYVDPNVFFGGKKVGGIRVRAPKQTAPPPPADEMPF